MMQTLKRSGPARALRWLGISAAAILLLALVSWLALPSLVKRLATEQVQAQIGRKLAIGDLQFAPATLTLTASDVTLYEPDQRTPAFSTKTLIINASVASLWHRALVLDEAKLVAPQIHLVRTSVDGASRYNFSDIIDHIQATPKSKQPARFALANLQVENGRVLFDDQVLHKQVKLDALTIGVPFLSNLPSDIDSFVTPQLSATVNGTPIALKGRSKPFAGSQETTLAIDFAKLDLASYVDFSPVALPVGIKSAKLSSNLNLGFSRTNNQPEVILSGDASLSDLVITDKAAAPLINAHVISAKIGKLNLLTGSAVIDQIKFDTPEVWAALDAKGELNWARIGGAEQAPPAGANNAVAAPPPATAKANGSKSSQTLRELIIANGTLHWSDDANAKPRQALELNKLALYAKQLSTAPNAGPANATLSASGKGDEALHFAGQITPSTSALAGQITLTALPLAQYQPYVNRALKANIAGTASLKTLIVTDAGQFTLKQLGVEIDQFQLTPDKASGAGSIAAGKIALDNASVDSKAHEIRADNLQLTGLRGDIRRNAQGKLNLMQMLVQDATPAKAAKADAATHKQAAPDWQVDLKSASLADAGLVLEDQSVTPSAKLRADAIKLTLGSISTRMQDPVTLDLQARLNQSGNLSVSGSLMPQTKAAELTLDGRNLPIAPFQPYFIDYVRVKLTKGQASAKGKLSILPVKAGQPFAFNYNGMVNLGNFRIIDKETDKDFLNWKSLYFTGINAKVGGKQPDISLGKIALSDFYARIIVSPEGKLNLQNIVAGKETPAGAPVVPDQASATAGKSTATVLPGGISAKNIAPPSPSGREPLIRIGQTTLQGGNINFTDNFVKPNYSANLTNMGGSVGALSSRNLQPAAIDLRGRIDSDAPVQISGSLNPLFKPLFLDVNASAKNIELTRLTPYAAKYAGYAIDKGKLSMDVAYHIENDKLTAQNHLNLDQLTFGEKMDSPDATKLPVHLAVALLKNSRGEIDINLPVSGTLSDPEFSIGGIVFRLFANLIVKAVTSPFALLSSAFGGGEELAYAEFTPGLAVLTPATRTRLDTLTKALKDRPALKLDISGRVDPQTDLEGIREAILARKIKALKRNDTSNQSDAADSDDLSVTEADKTRYLERIYKDEKFAKPRNIIGFAKTLPPNEMEKLILANMKVTPEQMRALADQRAANVRDYLEQKGEIAPERLFLIAPKLTAEDIKDKGSASRVNFALK